MSEAKPYTLHRGDSLEVLADLEEASVDAVVTDPPYGLGFMGKHWDRGVPGPAYWRECLRVLKPGGHVIAFAGSRTYHRMATAVEEAGFEIRDQLLWIYGSGFPKSRDVAAIIDRMKHNRADVLKVTAWIREARDAAGLSNAAIDEAFGFCGMAGHWTSQKSQPSVPTLEQVPKLLEVLGVAVEDVPPEVHRLLIELNGQKGEPGEAWYRREVVGIQSGALSAWDMEGRTRYVDRPISKAHTEAAKTWEGWGTALKPAHEPMVLARKPFQGSTAANVLEHGTGALNIAGCSIAAEKLVGWSGGGFGGRTWNDENCGLTKKGEPRPATGRWPANVCHDGSEPVLAEFAKAGEDKGAASPVTKRGADKFRNVYGAFKGNADEDGSTFQGDTGTAARFFYCAKPTRAERDAGLDGIEGRVFGMSGGPDAAQKRGEDYAEGQEIGLNRLKHVKNHHPTVKPIALMRWLTRLITPPGGVVLDPFMGSGTTGCGAVLEGFQFIGVDLDADENGEPLGYLEVAEHRLAFWTSPAGHAAFNDEIRMTATPADENQLGLFEVE